MPRTVSAFCEKARGHRDLVTVVGHAAMVAAGEWITASGEWVNDRTLGQQFKARFLRIAAPTSIDGIEKYLTSGMIRDIGPVYAKKLLHAFGEKVFDVIEAEPGRLREVDGIGGVRAARIVIGRRLAILICCLGITVAACDRDQRSVASRAAVSPAKYCCSPRRTPAAFSTRNARLQRRAWSALRPSAPTFSAIQACSRATGSTSVSTSAAVPFDSVIGCG
jgi:ATP-dependent exoDNAse (exonuclease V) alpha subunit